MSKLNVASYIDNTEVEGPGRRFALWVQGCIRRCAGCCNPHFLDFVPKTLMQASDVCRLIEESRIKNHIEGVTFLGGEPVLQARGLSEIAEFCRSKSMSVMLFTGYTYRQLLAENIPFVDRLLKYTDLLVDGAYMEDNPENQRNWVGSANQQFHFLTDFYKKGIEYDSKYAPGVEIRLYANGKMRINGSP